MKGQYINIKLICLFYGFGKHFFFNILELGTFPKLFAELFSTHVQRSQKVNILLNR